MAYPIIAVQTVPTPQTFNAFNIFTVRIDPTNSSSLLININADNGDGTEDPYFFANSTDCSAALAAFIPGYIPIVQSTGTLYLNLKAMAYCYKIGTTQLSVNQNSGSTFLQFSNQTDRDACYTLLMHTYMSILLGPNNLIDLTDPVAACSNLGLDATISLAGSALQTQVQVDWNATSGPSAMLNKPTLGTAAATNSSAYATAAQGALASTALQTAPVSSVAGRTGAVTLSNTDISGLGTAATTNTTAYATAAQGAKADTALQTAPVTSVAGRTGAVTLSNTDISGLGTAATTASSAYATSAQGALAATAYQASTPIPYSQLTGTPTIPAAQVQSDWNATTGLGVVLNKPTIPGNVTINSAPTTPPIVTTNVAANGAVLSTTKNVEVFYSLDLSTTASIAGNASVVCVLQINPSSSATTGWVTINKASNSQALSLAVALQSVQGTSGALSGWVPAGYSHRILNTISGTASATFAFGQTITQG